ncbi:MAG: SNF2 helicase associated domain-containing protein [Clostridia bacterium]
MLILAEEINKFLSQVSSEISIRGKKYFEQDKVKIEFFKYNSDTSYIAKAHVQGTYIYEVTIAKSRGSLKYSCDCPTSSKNKHICKHVIAMVFDMYINFESYMNFKLNLESKDIESEIVESKTYKYKQEKNDSLVTYYEELEFFDVDCKREIEIIPKLKTVGIYSNALEVSFKIGSDKMYNLRDVYKFGSDMIEEQVVKYGKELEFKHVLDAFKDESRTLANFIVKKTTEYIEFAKLDTYFTLNKKYKGMLKLKYAALDDFFDIFKNKSVALDENTYTKIMFIEEDPVIQFDILDMQEDGLQIKHDINDFNIFDGQTATYVLYKEKMYKCSLEYKKKIIPLLNEFNIKKTNTLQISKNRANSFCEYIIPHLKTMSKLNVNDKILEMYKAQNLGVKVYLDIDEKNNIIADIKFCYENIEFNPFDKEKQITCNRNIIAETKVKELFNRFNFFINFKKKLIYISNEEDIYNFLNDGINIFMQKFEVLVTEKLKNRKIINPKLVSMGVRIVNNFLEINLSDLGFSEIELKEIFKTYKLKKKYYRLNDGSFINIDSSGMDTLVNITDSLGASEKEISGGCLVVPKFRAIYLDSIVKQNNDINIQKDESFNAIVRDINTINESNILPPLEIKDTLRTYQKVGFSWLKTLEKYGFGGVLADDMGLGKTIQIITLLLDSKNNNNKTSLVVCPSSLYINWKNEIEKFAPTLKVLVVCGSIQERTKLIETILEYDVVLTSYDLIKRDIEKYLNYSFKYVIADEAQYIKNNNTKNAKALKKIKSEVRFALTGTPIENSLSELWSIFDFVLPGYLFSYKKFKDEIEIPIIKENDKTKIDRLQKLVAPFILRRIKKDVLKELPEKTETIMYSEMVEEQEKLYKSYLLKAKDEMNLELETNGFEKSKIKILALITRLRQICCHPALFIDNYICSSAKLIQCMEIIDDAISSGHKILLFSGFTSMFNIIIKEFEERKIKYSLLTGKTKVDTRIEMVDEFNKTKEINVFLVSLKAGGTGLNLTGADMVIHFDPWWNLSAQNQATDRAYRIGQRNNVQVFKLITQNSIEEKIQKLQEKKMDLTNCVIKEGETFINKMSKEEILGLFDM